MILVRITISEEFLHSTIDFTRKKTPTDEEMIKTTQYFITKSLRIPITTTTSTQCRYFFNQSKDKATNKGNGISYVEERIIGYAPNQIFNVVANVSQYKLFLPHVKDSFVISQSNGMMEAQLTVGFPPFFENYVSKVRFTYPQYVEAEATSTKLFKHLLNRWELSPVIVQHSNTIQNANTTTTTAASPPQQAQATKLRFMVEFKFASQWYQTVANMFFSFRKYSI
jgi:coenzyme Q-binding protein COQ10